MQTDLIELSAEGRTYTLNLTTKQIHREQIDRIKTTKQQWDLLLYLVLSAPRLIPRAELQERVWNNAPITDEAVSQALRGIRSLLNDRYSKSFIETEHGRGYRFIGNVRRSGQEHIAPASNQDKDNNAGDVVVNRQQVDVISDIIAKWSGSLDAKLLEQIRVSNIQLGTIQAIVDRFFDDIGVRSVRNEEIAARFKDVANRYIEMENAHGSDAVARIDDVVNGVSVFEEVVILANGNNLEKERIWAYVQLTLESLQRLKDAVVADQSFQLEHFGKVLALGSGEVPAEVKEEMRILHNMIDVPGA